MKVEEVHLIYFTIFSGVNVYVYGGKFVVCLFVAQPTRVRLSDVVCLCLVCILWQFSMLRSA